MKRVAFSFIELVFSIVIVGLVILSIPLIVRQSNANTIVSQNVIGYYNALTLMETIRGKPWDSNNVKDFEKSGEYYILDTDDTSNNCIAASHFKTILPSIGDADFTTKKGIGYTIHRRICDPEQKKASAIPTTSQATLDSINAFNNYSIRVTSTSDTDPTKQKNEFFRIESKINYVNIDFNGANNTDNITSANKRTQSSDVKEITINLYRIQPTGGEELVSSYKYYAANIGSNISFSKDNS